MIKFLANMYLVKGKIFELETCTLEGKESDSLLEKQENKIVPILQSLLNKIPAIKNDKKSVWFVELDECKWLESGSFKNFDKAIVEYKKVPHTPSEFMKLSKSLKKADEKEFLKSYSDEQGESI